MEAYYSFVDEGGTRRGGVVGPVEHDRLLEVLDTVTQGMAEGVAPARPGAYNAFYRSFNNCGFCAYDRTCSAGRDEPATPRAGHPSREEAAGEGSATRAFRAVAPKTPELSELLAALDGVVAGASDGRGADVEDEDFVTAAVVEISGQRMTVVSAGHPAPVLCHVGRAEQLELVGTCPPARPHVRVATGPGDPASARAGAPAGVHRRHH